MMEEKRQELFEDAEPAEDGGKFRLLAGVMGVVVLLVVGWIAISLNDLEEDLGLLRQDESKEVVALKAELAVLKQETSKEFRDVKETLSGVWHQHRPAELEFMGVLASLNAKERGGLLAALESLDGGIQSTGEEGGVPGSAHSGPTSAPPAEDPGEQPAPEPVEDPGSGPEPAPEPVEDPGSGPEPAPEPVEEPGSGPEPAPEPSGDPESPSDGGTTKFKEYRIQPGDSLSRIAQKHEVSAEALARVNGITDPDRIRVGQILRIPGE